MIFLFILTIYQSPGSELFKTLFKIQLPAVVERCGKTLKQRPIMNIRLKCVNLCDITALLPHRASSATSFFVKRWIYNKVIIIFQLCTWTVDLFSERPAVCSTSFVSCLGSPALQLACASVVDLVFGTQRIGLVSNVPALMISVNTLYNKIIFN